MVDGHLSLSQGVTIIGKPNGKHGSKSSSENFMGIRGKIYKVKKNERKTWVIGLVLSNSIAPTRMAESHFIIRLLLFIRV